MPAVGKGMGFAPAPIPAFGKYRSGYYYFTCGAGTTSAQALATGYIYAAPFIVPEGGVSIAKVGTDISIAGGSGSVVRLGCWADTGSAYPGTLIQDFGTIDGTSATVQDITLGSALVLPAGLYWVGTSSQVGTAPTIRTALAASAVPVMMTSGTAKPSSNTAIGGYFDGPGVTGAFGGTFSSSVNTYPTTQVPRIHFKVS